VKLQDELKEAWASSSYYRRESANNNAGVRTWHTRARHIEGQLKKALAVLTGIAGDPTKAERAKTCVEEIEAAIVKIHNGEIGYR
jgi:hypothetical protein